jgi:hypothetical protein
MFGLGKTPVLKRTCIGQLSFTNMSGYSNDGMVRTELIVFEAWIDEVMIDHCVIRQFHQT